MYRLPLNHPLSVTCLFAALVFVGFVSCFHLPIELLPNLKHPKLIVITTFASASAEEVESLLTKPVEEATAAVGGIRGISSTSSEGTSAVELKFDWGTNIGLAAAEVREKLDLITNELPRDSKLPIVVQYDPSDKPVMTLALTGPEDLAELRVVARNTVKTELETAMQGATIRLAGGLIPEIQVLVDQNRLAAHGLDLKIVTTALEKANINFPGGLVHKGSLDLPVRTVGRFKSLDEIGEVSLGRGTEGGAVRIRDVAEVVESHKDQKSISKVNGNDAVLLFVLKEPSANSVAVSDAIRKRLDALKGNLPAGMKLEIVDDEAPFIKAGLHNLRSNMLLGSGLAFAAILLALRSFGVSALIMFAIPVSVFSTFTFMSLAAISLNIMSIGGLALGVGMLLDCSIVSLQNIHRVQGFVSDTKKAIERAVREIAPSLLTGTLTILASLTPLVFMSGPANRLFRDFAFTLAVSLVISFCAAVILLPAMMVWIGREGKTLTAQRKPKFVISYVSLLSFLIKIPALIIVPAIVLVIFSGLALAELGFEILPPAKVGKFIIAVQNPSESTIEKIGEIIRDLENTLKQYPDISRFVTQSGTGAGEIGFENSTQKSNEIMITVTLKPGTFGYDHPEHFISLLQKEISNISPYRVGFSLRRDPVSRVLGSQGAQELIRILGDDSEQLNSISGAIVNQLYESNIFTDIVAEGNTWNEQLRVIVNRYQGAIRGVSVKDVAGIMRTAIEGTVTGKFITAGRELDIRARLKTKERTSVDDIKALPIMGAQDQIVFLDQIAAAEPGAGNREILRTAGKRTVILKANPVGASSTNAEEFALKTAASMTLPHNYRIEAGATRQERSASLNSLLMAIALAMALVYALLVTQFESLRKPFVVLSVLPMTIVGPAAILYYLNNPINTMTLIGILVLIGIVVNNAILLTATIDQRTANGESLNDAILNGAESRLQPIIMTTVTTILGALPICLSTSGGAALHKPLAVTLAAGLGVATLFTLFLLPAMYKTLVPKKSTGVRS